MSNGYEMKTKKGYDFFLASSAFQKAIRRSDMNAALFFMVELYESGYDEYLWKRIKIITSEDIGLSNESLPATIQALYQSYSQQKKLKDEKHRPERLFLTHAVLLLINSPKSRFVDWTLITYWNNHGQALELIQDYVYDKHTKQGRNMGRGIDHFYSEGAKLIDPKKILFNEDEMKQRAYHSQQYAKPETEQGELF